MLNKLKVTCFLSRHGIRAIHPKTYESLPYYEKTDKKHDRGCFPIMFPFLGMLHPPLTHPRAHSHTHTYIFFRDFSRHSVFWVSGLCIDSFSGNACVMSAPATGRPARWIRYTLPTTAPPPFCWGSFIGTAEMSRAYVVWVTCHCIEEKKKNENYFQQFCQVAALTREICINMF